MSSQSKQDQTSNKVSTQINVIQVTVSSIGDDINPIQQYTDMSKPSRDIPRDTQSYHILQRDWGQPKYDGKGSKAVAPTTQSQSGSIMGRWMQQQYLDEPYNNVLGIVVTSRNMQPATARPPKRVNARDDDSLNVEYGGST